MVAAELHARLRQLRLDVVGIEQTGRGAIEAARRWRPDLVLMNTSLERQFDGAEAATEIQRLDIPVVLVTARTDPRAIARATAACAAGCLARPFRDGDLAISIEMAFQRHRLEQQLRQRELHYATALATIGDGVIATDPDGRLTFMNPVAEVLTGWRTDRATGQSVGNVFALVDEATRQPMPCPIAAAIRKERAPESRQLLLLGGDGALVPVDCQIAVLRAPDGLVTGAVVAFRDVRNRQLAEDAARRAEDQLREGQRMQAIGHLAGGVAHDFNNLLTVINGYADALLEEGGLNPRAAKMLNGIRQAGIRSAALTSQLLSFSRRQVPAAQAIDPNCLVAGITEMLQRLIGEDIRLVSQLTPKVGLVEIDPSKLEQVIMNLVLNARDAMPDGGRVVIETSAISFAEPTETPDQIPAGRYVQLSVSDAGVGMEPEVQKRIFEPLFTTKAPGKGTGLGLATVFGIVREANGHILVFSAVDKGTVFKVYLPVHGESEGAVPTPADGGVVEPASRETVLVVDDHPDVREFAGIAISRFGYRVITASTGLEALAICETYPHGIDLLVTDVIMPVMCGQELAARVRTILPGIRVLYLSGYPDDALGRHHLDIGGEAFLQKPFLSEALARRIREVLDA